MALARRFDARSGKIIVTAYDGYLDRLSRWSDIQEYLPLLYEQAVSCPGARVLELGARRGNSTLAFLAGTNESGGHVWSVDIDDVLKYPELKPWQHLPNWTFIQGDDLAAGTQAKIPDEVDILFVDSDHEYEHVREELRVYMPKVVPGGVALFHDVNLMGWPGYKAPVPGVAPVAQALDEYCEETGQKWWSIPGEYGLGVIQG